MEAKDTVMSDTLIQVWVLEFMQPGELDLNAKLKEFAQAQAEISCKAGIMEVLKNTLQFRIAHRETLCDVGEWAECQDVGIFLYVSNDQLKEWGAQEQNEESQGSEAKK